MTGYEGQTAPNPYVCNRGQFTFETKEILRAKSPADKLRVEKARTFIIKWIQAFSCSCNLFINNIQKEPLPQTRAFFVSGNLFFRLYCC